MSTPSVAHPSRTAVEVAAVPYWYCQQCTATPFLISTFPDQVEVSRALARSRERTTYQHMHMGVQTRVRKCRHAGMWTASNKLERGDYRSCHFRYLTGATWTLLHSAPLSRNVAPSNLLATTLIYACNSQHTILGRKSLPAFDQLLRRTGILQCEGY